MDPLQARPWLTRERELVSIVDLYPTMLRVAGVEAPPSDGLDLAPSGARALAARRMIVAEEHERAFHPLHPNMRIDRDLSQAPRGDVPQKLLAHPMTRDLIFYALAPETLTLRRTVGTG